MPQQGEPSVEEILESIKKVIARDNREEALESRRRQAAAAEDLTPDEEVLDLAEMEFAEDHGAATSEFDDEDEGDDAPLTTGAVRASMRENFAALAMLAEPGAAPQIVRSGETSLEGLVRDMLRPMLSDWLDNNLPGMVEKMVQAEIARIAGKRR
ncbi:DUF2497 domain-containing protein [Erythrobacteraceae bacterium E2-1 Yellow Sea]|nr:DUF2497 domain-containing protein [Erythrobacteraceae bacterium E2-1 Yellow Sea]